MDHEEVILRLITALDEAKQIIRTWHGMGAEDVVADEMWRIYNARSPEMNRLNTALDMGKSYLTEE